MLMLKWSYRLFRDVVIAGFVNHSVIQSFAILTLIVLGFLFAAIQVSAPFIYTLF